MVQHRSRCQSCNCTDWGNPPTPLSTGSYPKMFSRLRHWRNHVIHTNRTFTSCWASTNDLHFFAKYPSSQTPKSIFKKTTVYMYVLFQNDDIWLWVGCEERWSVQWFSGSIKRPVWLILRIAEVLASKNSKLTPIMPWYTFMQAPTVSHNEAFSFILKVCVTQSSMIAINRKTFQWNSSEY